MVSATADLARLRAPGRGLFGSGGVLFSDAIFGRDSVTAASSLLHLYPEISREIILTLASLQGVVEAPLGLHTNEEEPGKIHHEHRSLYIDSRQISPSSEQLLHELASRWGGTPTSMTYYGCVDATPLYARLVGEYCSAYGDAILEAQVTQHDGRTVTIRQSLVAAMDWVTRKMDSSELGFVEFLRRNPDGIPFQVWKDSGTSYIHQDGTLGNWDAPIAAIEVQAYTYDALIGAARLLKNPEWRERAGALRERILERFWMPSDAYFAMAVDRDASGQLRLVDSLASNGALVLDTAVLDGLAEASGYVEGLARRICSPDFVTEAGIRCRSIREDHLVGFEDYHGAWTVWMKETFEVLRGLERQGLNRLARQLANRLLNAVNIAGANLEFLYVSPDGHVMYDFNERNVRGDSAVAIRGTNRPESPQAWTVTATLAVKWWYGAGRRLHGKTRHSDESAWRAALDADVASSMPSIDALRSPASIRAAYENRGDFVLNLGAGKRMDRRARETRRGGEPLAV